MGDWVVTPRRGKAVEINALWYNALSLLEGWLRETEDRRSGAIRRRMLPGPANLSTNASGSRKAVIFSMWSIATATRERSIVPAARIRSSPSRSIIRFWIQSAGLRLSIWCNNKLLTPVGLRSLSPDDPEYKPIYSGDLRSRDGAYHQGTVWAWLIGPFIDAWLKVHPDDKAECAQVSRRVSGASERQRPWHDQRSVRRTANPTTPAVASPRPGAWRKCCGAG